MWHGLYVAALKEVCVNLFHRAPPRIAALIDQGAVTIYPSGERLPRAIAVRAGNHLRPAHVLPRRRIGDRAQSNVFISMTEATGQLVRRAGPRGGAPQPDLAATMLRVIDDHARTAAEHARWRLSHGSLCPSNMQLDGGPLDLAQARTNPRSPPLAPEYGLDDNAIPRTDYMDRVAALAATYDALLRSTGASEHRRLNLIPLPIETLFDDAFVRHLTGLLLSSAGFKGAVTERLLADSAAVASRFAASVVALSLLRNPASEGKVATYDARAAVVNIFGLLGAYPRDYFDCSQGDQAEFVPRHLDPVFEGSADRIAENRRLFGEYCRDFAAAYRDLMDAAARFATPCYGGTRAMRESIAERAAFENRPIERLFFDGRTTACKAAAADFRSTGDTAVIRRFINATIADSVRCIDALLASGSRRVLGPNRHEVQIKVIDGLRYSVAVLGARRYIAVELTITPMGDLYRADLPDEPLLSRSQVRGLSYRYSFDSWASSGLIPGRVRHGDSRAVVRFLVPAGPRYASLEGEFVTPGILVRDGPDAFKGYVFAVPDRWELRSLFAASP
jgi:hypothetical protein